MDENIRLILNRNEPVNHDLIRIMILQDIFGFQQPIGRVFDHDFNWEDMGPEEFRTQFRFSRDDLPRLAQALRIPEHISTDSYHSVAGIEGLAILLKRLAYPNRLADLKNFFGRSSAALSEIANFMNNFIHETHGHLLDNLNHLPWLNQQRMQYYADAIVNKGAAVPNCWAFIDGTARAICRPSMDQVEYYSGHKRFHCVKYQSLVTPDGITVSCLGAFEGRRHDAGIFRQSNLYQQLEQKSRYPDGTEFVVFGDQAYGIRDLLLCPFPGRGINEEQQLFNNSMKTVREAVEWSFSKVVADFAFIDFKKNQKLLLQDVESMYKTATILTNCHSCLYGNQTAQFFNLRPITLEQYLV